jgi:hypothetical protein
MSWTIDYIPDLGIMVVTSHGTYSSSDDKRLLSELKTLCKAQLCRRVLVDHRGARVNYNIVELYKLPSLYESLGFTKDMKAALLLKRYSRDSAFYEIVCMNNGFQCKIFDNYDIALKWLLV